jgi:pimeloyl-ACP methyl ester carboxylesterase
LVCKEHAQGGYVPFVSIQNSPLARRAVELHYREFGAGRPLIFLHGGWGYHIYPINKQLHSLTNYRVLIPDRSGYGLSTKPAEFGVDFHARAAEEMFLFHCCPVKSRTESAGCRDRVSHCRSRMREVPVKRAFSRKG